MTGIGVGAEEILTWGEEDLDKLEFFLEAMETGGKKKKEAKAQI